MGLVAESKKRARVMRKIILETAMNSPAKGCHFGGALSCVDLLSALPCFYNLTDDIDKTSIRVTLSKGHASLALYALLNEQGCITNEYLKTFEQSGSYLAGHPIRSVENQIYFSTGSLGMGIGNATGQALYLKRMYGENSPKIVVILGDGEASEGIVYESLAFSTKYELSNLIIYFDVNGFQQTSATNLMQPTLSIAKLCEATGHHVEIIQNGNDHESIHEVLNLVLPEKRPKCIIGKTIKGFGINFMENNNEWHHNQLTEKDYKQSLLELE